MEGGSDLVRFSNPLSSQLENQTSSDPTTMERKEEDEELSFVVAYLFSPAIIIVAILLVRVISSIHPSHPSIHPSMNDEEPIHSSDLIFMLTYFNLLSRLDIL